MTLITSKSLQDWIDLQTSKWLTLEPNINTNPDSMVYMDASVIAEVLYLMQNDMVTLVNNAFLAYAVGDELSSLWADRGIPRLTATSATGNATFGRATKSPTNYDIPVGTLISTQPSGSNGIVIAFATTADTILYGTLWTPSIPSYTTQTTGGAIGNWTYSYKITAISADTIETDASPNLDVTISNGFSTNVISLTWTAVPNAVAYNVYIKVGWNYVLLHQVTPPTYIDTTGTSASSQQPPVTNLTGNLTVTAPIQASIASANGNVASNTITQFINKPVGLEFVYNADATIGGGDQETDDIYRTRISEELNLNTWKTTINGYQQTCTAIAWVGSASVVTWTWAYRNDITIVITSNSWDWVPSPALIAEVQDIVTRDENRAPCDAITVVAPLTTSINYTVNILAYDTGYSQAFLTSSIEDNVAAYFRSVPVGWIVYVVGIDNAIFSTLWVIDYTLTLPVANITLAANYIAISWLATINF